MPQTRPKSASLLLGQVQEHEVAPLLCSSASLFCILSSYFVLVPLREDAGLSLGTNTLPKLFTASLFGVLLFTPVATAFLGRRHVPKATCVRQFYNVIAIIFLLFYVLYYITDVHYAVGNGGVSGAAAQQLDMLQRDVPSASLQLSNRDQSQRPENAENADRGLVHEPQLNSGQGINDGVAAAQQHRRRWLLAAAHIAAATGKAGGASSGAGIHSISGVNGRSRRGTILGLGTSSRALLSEAVSLDQILSGGGKEQQPASGAVAGALAGAGAGAGATRSAAGASHGGVLQASGESSGSDTARQSDIKRMRQDNNLRTGVAAGGNGSVASQDDSSAAAAALGSTGGRGSTNARARASGGIGLDLGEVLRVNGGVDRLQQQQRTESARHIPRAQAVADASAAAVAGDAAGAGQQQQQQQQQAGRRRDDEDYEVVDERSNNNGSSSISGSTGAAGTGAMAALHTAAPVTVTVTVSAAAVPSSKQTQQQPREGRRHGWLAAMHGAGAADNEADAADADADAKADDAEQEKEEEREQQHDRGSNDGGGSLGSGNSSPRDNTSNNSSSELVKGRNAMALDSGLSAIRAQGQGQVASDAAADAAKPSPQKKSKKVQVAVPWDVKHGDPRLSFTQRALRCAFYIWLNVQNLVVASSMWARCADAFSSEAASRLFGIISAGATLGQLAGSLITMATVKVVSAPAANNSSGGGSSLYPLILLSAALMVLAGWLQARLPSPTADKADKPLLPGSSGGASGKATSATRGAGAASPSPSWLAQLREALDAFWLIKSSPYLMMVCTYLLMTYVVGSLMYFQRSQTVAATVQSSSARTAFFARLYSASALAILLLQLLATGRLLKRLGLTTALVVFPAVCGAGVMAIASTPTPGTVSLVEVLRKLLGYALVRPAREVLFTVVSRQEKYKAKLVIDAVVQRLGDTVAAATFEVIDVQLQLGPRAVALVALGACVVWAGVASQLGKRHAIMATTIPKHEAVSS